MTTQSIEGAMPPLPDSDHRLAFYDEGGIQDALADGYTADQMHAYAKAYAAPLLALVAELQAERDRMKDALEWVRGHISRYDPPGLPNHIAQRIDAALAAHKEQP